MEDDPLMITQFRWEESFVTFATFDTTSVRLASWFFSFLTSGDLSQSKKKYDWPYYFFFL